MSKPFKIIDIGHSGFTIDEAIAELETTVSDYIFYGNTSCLLYTSPSPRDKRQSRMPSSA